MSEVKSAVRVLDILELFSVVSEPIGVSEIARMMAIPKSSAQALLTTLVGRGYLIRAGSGYEMMGTYREDGWVGGALSRVLRFAEPMMQALAQKTGESAFLSVLAPNFEMKYISKAVSPNVVRYDAPLASLRPAYCVSSGIAILAWLREAEIERFFKTVKLVPVTEHSPEDESTIRALLEKARRLGYAELSNSNVPGASGVSAPVVDPTGHPLAALTLVGPTERFMKARVDLRNQVAEAAQELSRRIAPEKTKG